jgi:hypothetical protein
LNALLNLHALADGLIKTAKGGHFVCDKADVEVGTVRLAAFAKVAVLAGS